MTQPRTPEGTDASSVRKVVSLKVPPAVAWRLFTEGMGSWWPLETHKIGKAKAVDAVIEPQVGGRWYERGADGSTCDWGRVLMRGIFDSEGGWTGLLASFSRAAAAEKRL